MRYQVITFCAALLASLAQAAPVVRIRPPNKPITPSFSNTWTTKGYAGASQR